MDRILSYMGGKHIKYKRTVFTIGLCLLVILAFRYLTPFGSIVKYQFNINNNQDKISKVTGIENSASFTDNSSGGRFSIVKQVVRKNIATFQIKLLSKTLDGVWVNMRFKGTPKEVKIGVRGSTKEKYLYLPLYNQMIEGLTWPKLGSEDVSLWQKEAVFSTVESFVQSPPKNKTIATYFIDPASFFMEPPSGETQNVTINQVLRGTHTLQVQFTHPPFVLTVAKQDANAYLGKDTLSIHVYKGDQKIAEKEIPDDGITEKNNLTATAQREQVTIDKLDFGIYRIVLKDNSDGADIRIVNITVNQPRLIFNSPVFVLGPAPVTLVTNSRKIQMETVHSSSVQTVKLDDNYDLDISKEKVKYSFDLEKPISGSANVLPLHKLLLPKGDVTIRGEGVFAFSKEAFFDPLPIKTVDLTKISNLNSFDFVVSPYVPVVHDGDWLVAQVFFDSKNIVIDGDQLYFSLESPDLEASGGEITLDSLEVTTTKPSWFGNPVNTANNVKLNFWQRFIRLFKRR